jgi:hypothetical protein
LLALAVSGLVACFAAIQKRDEMPTIDPEVERRIIADAIAEPTSDTPEAEARWLIEVYRAELASSNPEPGVVDYVRSLARRAEPRRPVPAPLTRSRESSSKRCRTASASGGGGGDPPREADDEPHLARPDRALRRGGAR